MAAKARALKAKGIKVYDFTVGEPDQPTPRHVAEAGKAVAEVVKLRYFAGLTIAETAAALGISVRTANRHWAYARAWLYQHLSQRAEVSE